MNKNRKYCSTNPNNNSQDCNEFFEFLREINNIPTDCNSNNNDQPIFNTIKQVNLVLKVNNDHYKIIIDPI